MRNVALDLGTKKTSYCEVRDGQVVQRGTVSAIETLATLLGPDQPPATVAVEACREAWYVHEHLTSWGNHVVLVDTTRSKQLGIGQHGRKTDRIDAEVLARAVERGGIPLAHVLSPHRRELRRIIGVRRTLVESRAQIVTTMRGLAREHGEALKSCHVDHFVANVRKIKLSDGLRACFEPLLQVLETLDRQLSVVESELAKVCAVEPTITLLCTAPGVGAIVAASFVSVVDDAKRFQGAHQLQSYLGLVPSEDSSGGKRRVGAITKKGNSYLRLLLVQAAWAILRHNNPDDPLKLWALAVAKRRGKRIAVIALARRLAGVLWAMWRGDKAYDPHVLGQRSAKGLRSSAEQIQFQADALKRAASKRSTRLLSQEPTS